MLPDATILIERLDIRLPLIGLYDAPDVGPFEPVVRLKSTAHQCVFAFYQNWLKGQMLLLGEGNYGCGGAARVLGNISMPSRPEFISFLVDEEGLKDSHELMDQWIDRHSPYRQKYTHLLIGPLRPEQYTYLKTATFLVNPDQLSALIIGANYHHAPSEPVPVLAPFGSGCMEMLPAFDDLDAPQALIGATDIAMRQYLPPDILAFTVTKPMFERLCSLDQRSFLYKPFLKRLRKARGKTGLSNP